MTSERDFDRLARAWLELGPDEAPDRVIDAVLQAAETTPQVRRRLAWPDWRSFPVTRLPLAATAVAVLAVVVGGLFLTRSNGPTTGLSPSSVPSPSASAPVGSPSPAGQIPPEVRSTWIGPKRTIAGMPVSDRYRFRLTDLVLDFPDDNFAGTWFTSMASASGPGQLRLVAAGSNAGCRAGDEGHYTWSLSPGGVHLTVVSVSDACAARAAALTGDWIRVACQDITDGCFGDLEAGTYPSQYIDPRVGVGETWKPNYGALTYTVPAGWSNSSDWPRTFSLMPTADYGNLPAGAFHEISVYGSPAATAQNAACSNDEQTTVKPTVDGLVAWVRSRPSLVVSAPVPVTVGGHPGQTIDVKLAPSWTAKCPDTTAPNAVFLMDAGSAGSGGYTWGIGPGERQRLTFLDLGSGDIALIGIDSTYPDRFDDLVSQATPIIQSLTFK